MADYFAPLGYGLFFCFSDCEIRMYEYECLGRGIWREGRRLPITKAFTPNRILPSRPSSLARLLVSSINSRKSCMLPMGKKSSSKSQTNLNLPLPIQQQNITHSRRHTPRITRIPSLEYLRMRSLDRLGTERVGIVLVEVPVEGVIWHGGVPDSFEDRYEFYVLDD